MGLKASPVTQSPAGYSAQNLQGQQLAARMAGTASAAQRANLRVAIQDSGYRYRIHPTETAAGLVEANLTFGYDPGDVRRYGAAGDGVADDAPAIMRAMSCNTVVYLPTPSASYGIKQPIYILNSYPQNIILTGASRTTTIIQPLVTDLSVNDPNANGINAMFINQQTNGKLCFSNLRLSSQIVAYTGITIYAVQPVAWSGAVTYAAGDIVTSGGNCYKCILTNTNQIPPNATYWALQPVGVGQCQCIFSGYMENCWGDTGSTNSGFWKGGMSNYAFRDTTWEFQKGVFLLQGASPAGDAFFTDCVLSNCYDYFIQHTDSNQMNEVSVKGLHVYTHNRGVLFNIANSSSFNLQDVLLQAALANLGTIGIGTFQNCTDMQLSELNVLTSATVGTGATGTQLTFNGCTGTISDTVFDGVDTGILLTGGASRLSFDHVDIINTVSYALHTTTAASSGLITANHCNWSDGQGSLVYFTNSCTMDFYLSNCRLMNAGLGASAISRNLSLATSGLAILKDCVLGQNNGAAAAQYITDCAGTGDLILIDPVFIGVGAGGSVDNPAATQLLTIGRRVVPYSANMTFSVAYFDHFVIVATNNTAFTINLPTVAVAGKQITVQITNSSGGALGAVTWNAGFHLAGAWVSPANGNNRSITFRYAGGGIWYELNRSAADVAN